MAAVVIRNIPEATHKALKARAKAHGRSTEAEIRDILEKALKPAPAAQDVGKVLHEFGMRYGGIELQIEPRTELARAAKFG
jgi:plasmid stability protein